MIETVKFYFKDGLFKYIFKTTHAHAHAHTHTHIYIYIYRLTDRS